jgi:hypothetical protein
MEKVTTNTSNKKKKRKKECNNINNGDINDEDEKRKMNKKKEMKENKKMKKQNKHEDDNIAENAATLETKNQSVKEYDKFKNSDSKKKKKQTKKKRDRIEISKEDQTVEISTRDQSAVKSKKHKTVGDGEDFNRHNAKAHIDDDEDDDLNAALTAWASSSADANNLGDSHEEVTSNHKEKKVNNFTCEHIKDSNCILNSQSTINDSLILQALQQQQMYLNHQARVKKNYTDDNDTNHRLFSLHLTQLPYNCTEMEIRELFGKIGCQSSSILDVRMVYDPIDSSDVKNKKTKLDKKIHDAKSDNNEAKNATNRFRGVAFVDVIDEKTYQLAIELIHQKIKIRSRLINVRPVKTKAELNEIVQSTKQKRKEQIQQDKTGKRNIDTVRQPKKELEPQKKSSKHNDSKRKQTSDNMNNHHSTSVQKKIEKARLRRRKKGSKDERRQETISI